MTRRGSIILALCLASALLLLAGGASAGKVKLTGKGVFGSGTEKLKLGGGPTCDDPITLGVAFGPERTFAAVDDNFNEFIGRYKQTGAGGRTVIFKLNRTSKRRLKRLMKDAVRDCTGGSKVSVNVQDIDAIGKVNKTKTAMVLKFRVEGTGKVDGDSGSGVYSFRVRGPLEIIAP